LDVLVWQIKDNSPNFPTIRYYHFRADESVSGVVMMKEYINTDETNYTVLRSEKMVYILTVDDLLLDVTPTRMSPECQLYLY